MSGIRIGTCFGRDGLLLTDAVGKGRSKESWGEGRSPPVDDEFGLTMGIDGVVLGTPVENTGVISWTPLEADRSRVNDTQARDEREWGFLVVDLGFFAGLSRSKKDELKDHDSAKEVSLVGCFLGFSQRKVKELSAAAGAGHAMTPRGNDICGQPGA